MSQQKIYWSKENLPSDFSILMEKLSVANNLDVRDLYDNYKDKTVEKKISKKKKLIIEKNILNKEKLLYKEDKVRIKNYENEKKPIFETWIRYLKTEKGRNELKILAFKKLTKKDGIKKIELLLQINDKFLSEIDKLFLNREKKK